MATVKQKKAFDNAVGNGGNITKGMRDANYSENTLNTPQKLTNSKGFKELADELLPDDLILNSLREDIKNKPSYRASELQLGAKIKGMLSDKLDITSNNQQITGFTYIKPTKVDKPE